MRSKASASTAPPSSRSTRYTKFLNRERCAVLSLQSLMPLCGPRSNDNASPGRRRSGFQPDILSSGMGSRPASVESWDFSTACGWSFFPKVDNTDGYIEVRGGIDKVAATFVVTGPFQFPFPRGPLKFRNTPVHFYMQHRKVLLGDFADRRSSVDSVSSPQFAVDLTVAHNEAGD